MNNKMQNTAKPKMWKMMLIAFIFVYPAINVIFFLFGDFLFGMHQLIRTFVLAGIFVPLFGICIPLLQRKFHHWTIK